jgi:FMN phosphatase YigB (HAD superfamily)
LGEPKQLIEEDRLDAGAGSMGGIKSSQFSQLRCRQLGAKGGRRVARARGARLEADQLMSNSSIKRRKRATPQSGVPGKIVFLFDVDNTLLDNDRVTADLKHHLEKEVGRDGSQCYWSIFERLRSELGYADYLGALQRYRSENPHDSRLITVSRFLIDYPFVNRLFPNSLDVVERVKQWGPAVILSDGDVVFQPRKVERSGLFEAVNGNVLIYAHKEQELDDVAQRFPADHYVMVDDKLRILAAIKIIWGRRVTTVFVRQGHYALDQRILAAYPAADVSIGRIGALLNYNLQDIVPRAAQVTRGSV